MSTVVNRFSVILASVMYNAIEIAFRLSVCLSVRPRRAWAESKQWTFCRIFTPRVIVQRSVSVMK